MLSAKPTISLVVTDLDNTLYDWVTYFVRSFYQMVSVASGLLHLPEEELLDQLQSVHRYYHDSEYPFALLETNAVRAKFASLGRRETKELLDSAFHAFNKTREETLRLYPTVVETLRELGERGTTVVGHTEASAPNALFRLRKLGCLAFIHRLYAIEHVGEDHPHPEKSLRYDPDRERIQFLQGDQRKPNASILLTICRKYQVEPSAVLYVGDSVSRDIGMAKEAGTHSAFAQYGTHFEKALWAKLVRVTHWSEEDIRRNEEARERYGAVSPDVVLETSFGQILEHFDFERSAR